MSTGARIPPVIWVSVDRQWAKSRTPICTEAYVRVDHREHNVPYCGNCGFPNPLNISPEQVADDVWLIEALGQVAAGRCLDPDPTLPPEEYDKEPRCRGKYEDLRDWCDNCLVGAAADRLRALTTP